MGILVLFFSNYGHLAVLNYLHSCRRVVIFFAMQCASFVSAQASGFSELIGPPPLAYKKWRFDGQKEITDIASCGEVMLLMIPVV